MKPGEASPITSTQLGGLASRRYFLMHIPMKHTPIWVILRLSSTPCVCAHRTTHLFPSFLPFSFLLARGVSLVHVSCELAKPLRDRGSLLLCQFEVVFSAVSVFLLHALPQLARWQPQHGHTLRYQRRARIVGPPGGLKNAPSLAAGMGTWARGLPSAPVRQSSQVAPPALRPLLDTWRCVTVQH